MNNMTKVFGVLVVGLLAASVFGSSATVFTDALDDGDYEITVTPVSYCTLGTTCGIFGTTSGDSTVGALYLANTEDAGGATAPWEVPEGAVRLLGSGFVPGSRVMEDDVDFEGVIYNFTTGYNFTWGEIIDNNKLDSQEYGYVYLNQSNTAGEVIEDDILLTGVGPARVDEDVADHGFELDLVSFGATTVFCMDSNDDGDCDADEPLFVDTDFHVDSTNTAAGQYTADDLDIGVGKFFTPAGASATNLLPQIVNFTLVDTSAAYATSLDDLQFVIGYDPVGDAEDDYVGEDLILIKNRTLSNGDNVIDKDSIALTGPNAGKILTASDAHVGEEFNVLIDESGANTVFVDGATFCFVDDNENGRLDASEFVFLHLGDSTGTCDDAEQGDIDILDGQYLADDVDSDGESYAYGMGGVQWRFGFLDLNNDTGFDAGEPFAITADGDDGAIEPFDLLFGGETSGLQGLGSAYLDFQGAPLIKDLDEATTFGLNNYWICAYREEDPNDDTQWLWLQAFLVFNGTNTDPGCDEDFDHDAAWYFGLTGSFAGRFVSEAETDELDGELVVPSATTTFGNPELGYVDDNGQPGFNSGDTLVIYNQTAADTDFLFRDAFVFGGERIVDGHALFDFEEGEDFFELAEGTDYTFIALNGTHNSNSGADMFIAGGTATPFDNLYLHFGGDSTTPLVEEKDLVLHRAASPSGPTTTTTTTTTSSVTTTGGSTTTSGATTTTGGAMTSEGGSTQTPGFELVALVAALGAALVLVRRRV